jgi:large subunit ribosomal protein L15
MEKKILKPRKVAKKETKAEEKPKPKEKAPVARARKKEDKEVVSTMPGATLFSLKPPAGAHKRRKYLGRGPSSGHGKTSTRGSKGQTSRAGRHFYLGFEGGQSPLIRRMPKRGFTSRFKKEYQILNLNDLNRIKETTITLALLEEKGLIKDKNKLVKVLGEGEVKNPITIQAHAFSKKASEVIKNAGGKVEIINA